MFPCTLALSLVLLLAQVAERPATALPLQGHDNHTDIPEAPCTTGASACAGAPQKMTIGDTTFCCFGGTMRVNYPSCTCSATSSISSAYNIVDRDETIIIEDHASHEENTRSATNSTAPAADQLLQNQSRLSQLFDSMELAGFPANRDISSLPEDKLADALILKEFVTAYSKQEAADGLTCTACRGAVSLACGHACHVAICSSVVLCPFAPVICMLIDDWGCDTQRICAYVGFCDGESLVDYAETNVVPEPKRQLQVNCEGNYCCGSGGCCCDTEPGCACSTATREMVEAQDNDEAVDVSNSRTTVAAVITTIEAEGASISDGKGIATSDNQTMLTTCSPHSRFYSFRGSSWFSSCPSFSPGQTREVRVNFRSYNNDAYYIKIEVCAIGSSSNCVSSMRTKYSGSGGDHNVVHNVGDRGYSSPYVRVTFECDNWIESCQIDMTGADQFISMDEGY